MTGKTEPFKSEGVMAVNFLGSRKARAPIVHANDRNIFLLQWELFFLIESVSQWMRGTRRKGANQVLQQRQVISSLLQ